MYEDVLDTLHWFRSPAPYDYWFEVSTWGMVIATKYQKLFLFWCKKAYCTFLPLHIRDGHDLPWDFIHMAFICGNHFIALHMVDDFPLPPISCTWRAHCDPNIRHWPESVYHLELTWYHSLRPKNSENVVVVE